MNETKECEFDGCNRKYVSQAPGMSIKVCMGHYHQAAAGKELRPLMTKKRYAAPAPGKKICTSCEQIKDVETNFYRRTSGKPHAWCKKCMIRKNRQNTVDRKAREAADV